MANAPFSKYYEGSNKLLQPGLPGWERVEVPLPNMPKHHEARRCYYRNRQTGEATWLTPADCDDDTPIRQTKDKREPDDLPLPPNTRWEVLYDRTTNKHFYRHKETHERSWYRPMDGPHVEQVKSRFQTMIQALAESTDVGTEQDERTLWNEEEFKERLRRHAGKPDEINGYRATLARVKPSNDNHIALKGLHVPTTVAVKYKDCMFALTERIVQAFAQEPRITMSRMSTVDATIHFARDPNRVVCALNFANGCVGKAGGEYAVTHMNFAGKQAKYADNDSQEEDLCRRIGNFYQSLIKPREKLPDNSMPEPLYPFGPCLCTKSKHTHKYADVLFTPYEDGVDSGKSSGLLHNTTGLYITRGPKDAGYPIIPDHLFRRCCIVSAAPPIIQDRPATYVQEDFRLLFQTIVSIFVAPILKEGRCTTLILGAWGCGSRCGNDAKQIAKVFVQAIIRKMPRLELCLGNLYHDIHFAIEGEENYSAFQEVFKQNAVEFTEIEADPNYGHAGTAAMMKG